VALGILRQVARLRRAVPPHPRDESGAAGRDGRLRDAADVRSRADAQDAATAARRRLGRDR
jgi:hypothetical protein